MVVAMGNTFGLAEKDCVLPVVPMFHVNAWGLPFASVLVGAKMMMPGPHLDPASLLEDLEQEGVTFTAGVPTVWLGVLQLLDKNPEMYDVSSLKTMLTGGQAAPEAMIRGFKERHGINVVHAWGMTETTPLGTVTYVPSEMREAPEDEQYHYLTKQGRPSPLVEIRAHGEGGLVPWDGQTMGELVARGPWVAATYYNDERSPASFTSDGWFRTGDIATVQPNGYIEIADRTKDVIKSGGEWISSVALENALMAHPKVLEAAVIAVPHARWSERPMACVVPRPDAKDSLTPDELTAYLAQQFAKWWLPDQYLFLNELPKTSVGKFDKKAMRQQYAPAEAAVSS
jgi:fatty-acyl-CoA synthase